MTSRAFPRLVLGPHGLFLGFLFLRAVPYPLELLRLRIVREQFFLMALG